MVAIFNGTKAEGERREMSKGTRAALCLIVAVVGLLASLPAGATAAVLNWSAPINIDGSHRLDALDCPSSALCVAGDGFGRLLSSTNPGSVSSWHVNTANESAGHDVTGLACADTSLCLGSDYFGNVLTSTDPAANAWNSTGQMSIGLSGISCPSTSLCVAAQQDGELLYNLEPEEPGVWETSGTISPAHGLTGAISCPTASLCVAADYAGDVLTSTEPTEGPSKWTTTPVDPELEALDCPSATFCAATDAAGNVLTTANPIGGTWAKQKIVAGNLPTIACVSASFCVAADEAGNLLESVQPTAGASAWVPVDDVTPPTDYIGHVSCPSAAFCAAVDGVGNAYIASPLVPPRYLLTVREAGTGTAIVTSVPAGIDCNGGGGECSRSYAGGTVVTLTGSAHEGERFDGWTGGGCSGTSPCQVALSTDTEVTAHVSLEEESTAPPTRSPSGGTSPATPPPSSTTSPSQASPKKPKPLRCRKGFKKQRAHGKAKCAKVKKKRHRS